MIITSLPYKIEQLDEIKHHGALVKMSENDFSDYNVDDKILTSLVYLRNTAFENISLDFTGVSYDDRCRYLILFLTDNIYIKNCMLIDVWYYIFEYYLHLSSNNKKFDFFTTDELTTFISEHSTDIQNALSVIKSLLLFAITHANINNYDKSTIIHVDDVPIGANLIEFITHPLFVDVLCKCYTADNIQSMYYDEIFDVSTVDIMTAIDKSLLGFGIFLGFNGIKAGNR